MSGPAADESEPTRDGLDPVVFDRLVDGELAETERRKLLLSLDHQPSGWRQCALAFLEAQSWRELFPAAAKEPIVQTVAESAAADPNAAVAAEAPQIEAAELQPAARRRLPKQWLWTMELAAGFLIAFSLGLWLRGGLTTTTTTSERLLPPLARSPVPAASRTIQVTAEGGGGRVEQMQVPLVDNSRLPWWQSQPAAVVPEEVRRAVERSGGQIRQERKYFPVQLPDGRHALVPIDQIELVPAGDRGMQ